MRESDRHLLSVASNMHSPIRSSRHRRSLPLWLALGVMSCGAPAGPARGHEFSADIVSRDAAGLELGTAAKLHVADGKVRIETPTAAAEFFLVDGDTGAAFFVRPLQRLFMDAKQSSVLTQISVPMGPKGPCRQWRAASINAGVPGAGGEWRCARIAASSAGERDAVEYRVVSPDQKS